MAAVRSIAAAMAGAVGRVLTAAPAVPVFPDREITEVLVAQASPGATITEAAVVAAAEAADTTGAVAAEAAGRAITAAVQAAAAGRIVVHRAQREELP